MTDHLFRYSEKELIHRAMLNARPNRCNAEVPLWAAVEDTFGLGETVAVQLCKALGFDPEEKRRGPVCEVCADTEVHSEGTPK